MKIPSSFLSFHWHQICYNIVYSSDISLPNILLHYDQLVLFSGTFYTFNTHNQRCTIKHYRHTDITALYEFGFHLYQFFKQFEWLESLIEHSDVRIYTFKQHFLVVGSRIDAYNRMIIFLFDVLFLRS